MDKILNIQSIPVNSEDILILTFGNGCDIDEIKEYCGNFEKNFPGLKIYPNFEGFVKDITILKKDEILSMLNPEEGGSRLESCNLY